MTFSYFHEKLSLAIIEMRGSTRSPKDNLRISVLKHTFSAFPLEIAPEEVRGQFSEIKGALAGKLHRPGSMENYPDVIDRMKPAEVRRVLDNILSVYQGVTKEYHQQMFQGSEQQRGNSPKAEDVEQSIKKLLSR